MSLNKPDAADASELVALLERRLNAERAERKAPKRASTTHAKRSARK